MQGSLRVPLAVAVMAAGVGLVQPPTLAATHLSVPALPDVALAGLSSPLGALIGTVQVLNNDLFNGIDTYPDYPWDPFQGIGPEFIYVALPIISQLGFNGFNYLGGSIDALSTSAQILTDAVWNLPGAIVTAAGQAIGGQFSEALATLVEATLAPIQDAGQIALDAGLAVLGGVAAHLTNVVVSLPGIAGDLLATVGGALSAIAGAAVTIGSQTLAALTTLDLEGAWNTVVDGLLGPVGVDGEVTSSLPGTLLAVTVGPGLGPLGPGNGYAVPSLRMWAEKSQLTIANAVGANFPVTTPQVTPAAARSLASAASAEPAAEPATEAAASTDAVPGDPATSPLPPRSDSRTLKSSAATPGDGARPHPTGKSHASANPGAGARNTVN